MKPFTIQITDKINKGELSPCAQKVINLLWIEGLTLGEAETVISEVSTKLGIIGYEPLKKIKEQPLDSFME